MAQRYQAWHTLRPHAGKKFPSLEEFMGLKAKAKPALDTNTVMRRWVAVMAAAEAQAAKKSRKPKSEV